MSKKKRHQERRLRAGGVRHDPPDLKKLAGALIALAQAQAETDAATEHQSRQTAARPPRQRGRAEPSDGDQT